MSRFTAPDGTEVSTIGPGGEEMRAEFKKGALDVKDEVLEAELNRLAADKANVVGRARKTKED